MEIKQILLIIFIIIIIYILHYFILYTEFNDLSTFHWSISTLLPLKFYKNLSNSETLKK